MNWRTKRKIVFWLIIIFLFGALSYLIYLIYKPLPSSCFDGKRNFDEEDVDCGGSCPPCELRKFVPLKEYETKFLIYPDKTFDIFSIIENPNLRLGLKKLVYQFLIYDSEGKLRSSTTLRQTSLWPEEKRYLIELNKNLPDFEIGKIQLSVFKPAPDDWLKIEKKKEIQIKVYNIRKSKINNRWQIKLTLFNPTFENYQDISLIFLVYNKENNLIAISENKFSLKEEETQEIVITLPLIQDEPYSYSYHFQSLIDENDIDGN
ncbi:MAG: hypothetical protein NZ822_02255 [Patescibacteria group bacterium]|nr:hypothetical protein [Patescibacteria group bacterium]